MSPPTGQEAKLLSPINLNLFLPLVRTCDVTSAFPHAANPYSVETAYPGQVASMPHKYVQNGQYLIVTPSGGGGFRIVFETDGQQVTAIRAGRTPEVEWVERCG